MSVNASKRGYVKTIEFDDIVDLLPAPKLIELQQLAPPDIFISAIGFEERVVKIPELLSTSWSGRNRRSTKAILGFYRTNTSDNECNRDTLEASLREFCYDIDKVCAEEARAIAEAIDNVIGAGNETRSVIFDISGASSDFILSVIAALLRYAEKVRLCICYSSARTYFPEKPVDEAAHIAALESAVDIGDENTFAEYGFKEPFPNELYPGRFQENRADIVIAIPSFRTNRLLRCIQALGDQVLAAPRDSIYWIFGATTEESLSWRSDFQRAMVAEMLWSVSGSDPQGKNDLISTAKSMDCSVIDYRQTIRQIMKIADDELGARLTVLPMGSKMQSVGVALALAARDEIAVLSARPSGFNPRSYSIGSHEYWYCDFGQLSEVKSILSRVGELQYEAIGS